MLTNWELMVTALIVAIIIFLVLICTQKIRCCLKTFTDTGPGHRTNRTQTQLVTISSTVTDFNPPAYEECVIDKLPRYDELFDEDGKRKSTSGE